ncbi:MAG: hypothetical protein ACLFVW_03760 [Phycisphaerae bacterium]
MDGIKTALFEEPFYIYVALGFAELVLLAVWYERRTPRWAMSLLAPVVLAGAVFLVEAVVETDREQITRALGEIAADAGAGRTDAGERYLADDYKGFGGSKQQIISRADSVIKRFNVRDVNFVNLQVELRNSTARTTFSSVISLGASSDPGRRVSMVWDIRWEKRGDEWRIVDMDRPRMGMEL